MGECRKKFKDVHRPVPVYGEAGTAVKLSPRGEDPRPFKI
jgi:hypothetical protein